ncbi:MAG TPA: GAF domain-containing protein, partial [Gemmatimonadaceae bacterium]|nr:GAF domain-containing protein [Gemmatimonadaceae bacterium]
MSALDAADTPAVNRLSALALALSLLAASRPSLAQLTPAAASRAVPIGELLDRNRDGRLDRDGDTVIVAGRASVASGALYRGFLSVWIEDATGGILLFQRGKPRPIAAGDSVIARGVLTPYLGMSEVEVLDYLVVPGPRRLPTTVPVAVNPVALTARSGQLGTVEGHLVGWGSDAGGVYAVLRGEDHVTHIAMFVSTPVVAQIELAQYGMGDHLRVTGIIVPFEPSDELPSTPHATYRVVPRGAADVELVGMSFVLRRAVALAMPLVLLAALATVLVLRREVRRKTRRLQESEQRFRSLFEYNPDAVAEYDLGGRLLAANPACERVSGRAERDLLGTRLADAGLPEERTRIERAFILAARGGAQRFEIPMRSAQGTVDQVDMSLMPIVVNGEVAGVYGIAKDVSARHRVQQELEANARLLSAIIDTQQAIARTELDVHTLMGRIIELVPRLTAGDTAGIGVVEGDALLMPHMVVNGEPLRLPLAGSLSGRAVVEGQTLRTGDALQDPRVHRGAQQKIGFRSLMAIPLSYGGTTIGVLTVSSLQPDAFTETDERTLQLLAGQL